MNEIGWRAKQKKLRTAANERKSEQKKNEQIRKFAEQEE